MSNFTIILAAHHLKPTRQQNWHPQTYPAEHPTEYSGKSVKKLVRVNARCRKSGNAGWVTLWNDGKCYVRVE